MAEKRCELLAEQRRTISGVGPFFRILDFCKDLFVRANNGDVCFSRISRKTRMAASNLYTEEVKKRYHIVVNTNTIYVINVHLPPFEIRPYRILDTRDAHFVKKAVNRKPNRRTFALRTWFDTSCNTKM